MAGGGKSTGRALGRRPASVTTRPRLAPLLVLRLPAPDEIDAYPEGWLKNAAARDLRRVSPPILEGSRPIRALCQVVRASGRGCAGVHTPVGMVRRLGRSLTGRHFRFYLLGRAGPTGSITRPISFPCPVILPTIATISRSIGAASIRNGIHWTRVRYFRKALFMAGPPPPGGRRLRSLPGDFRTCPAKRSSARCICRPDKVTRTYIGHSTRAGTEAANKKSGRP